MGWSRTGYTLTGTRISRSEVALSETTGLLASRLAPPRRPALNSFPRTPLPRSTGRQPRAETVYQSPAPASRHAAGAGQPAWVVHEVHVVVHWLRHVCSVSVQAWQNAKIQNLAHWS